MILAGDVGGTSTRIGLFKVRGNRIETIKTGNYTSRDYPSLGKIASTFLGEQSRLVAVACFGIAGPVRDGRVAGPNLAWETHDKTLACELGLSAVKLINDLEANAHGIAALEPGDLVTLQTGNPNAVGNRAVISVGTGLGEAGIFWNGSTHSPFASEGGHVDFAPRDERESKLLAYLRAKYGRVSYERVLSGNGQQLLYEFLRDEKYFPESPQIAEALRLANPDVVITRAGLDRKCELCVEALNLYASLYGAEAGNLALKMMATGGIYIGGGIAPKIIQKLKEPIFLNGFLEKGRMKPLLETIPIHVIMKDTTALLGAARVAFQMCDSFY